MREICDRMALHRTAEMRTAEWLCCHSACMGRKRGAVLVEAEFPN